MRIASVIIEGFVNSIYRSFIPMQALAERGHAVHVEERNQVVRPERFEQFDVVCFWRCFHDPMPLFARRLRQAGVPIVWDNDDDLTSIARDNPGFRRMGGLNGQRAKTSMVKMMRMADIVTAPSINLADRFHEMSGAETRVLENYIPTHFAHSTVHSRRSVTIGWLAGQEHRSDLEQLRLRRTFTDLLEAHDHVSVVTIGLNVGVEHPHYRHVPALPYPELPRLLADFDIGIAPLADTPFNRPRSNVKLKEYSVIGVPWLASPIGPYADMGEAEGGMLVADDRWFEALSALANDPGRRRTLATAAKRWGSTQRIAQHVDKWEAVLHEAIEHAQRSRAAAR